MNEWPIIKLGGPLFLKTYNVFPVYIRKYLLHTYKITISKMEWKREPKVFIKKRNGKPSKIN